MAPLFRESDVLEHNNSVMNGNFVINSKQLINGHYSALTDCACLFIIKKDWMGISSKSHNGYIDCPR